MPQPDTPTPFEVVARDAAVRRAPKREVVLRVRELEQLVAGGTPSVVAACLQDARVLTPRTLRVYEGFAAQGARVRLLGQGLSAWLAPGVEGVDLDPDDPLVDQWTLVASGSRCLCFAARDLLSPTPDDAHRDFEWTLTADPRQVSEVLQRLGLPEHADVQRC